MTWFIILILLVLIFCIPIGIDNTYENKNFVLKLKLLFLRLQLFPAKTKESSPSNKETKNKIENKSKKHRQLRREDYITLVKIGFSALKRFRVHLCIDLFQFYFLLASDDPYKTVINYGRVNAIISTLHPLVHSVANIQEEDIKVSFDFEANSSDISYHLVFSIQIWEVLWIVFCAGIAILRWYLCKRISNRRIKLGIEKG